MDQLNQIYIGRQPIFNKNMRTYAYEILFRTSTTSNYANVVDDNQATAQVMINLFSEFGLDNIVGNKKAFINFSEELLLKDIQSFLPKRKVVLEVLETAKPSSELISQLKELSKKGYSIALDDYDFSDELSPFEDLVDIIKIDILAAGSKKLIANMPRLKAKDKRLLAEKIETKQQYEFCKQLGFDFFQGYFFSKPKIIEGKALGANQAATLQFLSSVFDLDVEMDHLSKLVRQDVAMSQKLLKMANQLDGVYPVKSILDVVNKLGLNRLQSWASVVALSNVSDKPPELLTTSLVRARFCELIGEKQRDIPKDTYFMVGLFSTLDAVMDQSMKELLKDLSFDKIVEDALVSSAGNLGKALIAVREIENGSTSFEPPVNLTPTEVSKIYLQAIEFTNNLNL